MDDEVLDIFSINMKPLGTATRSEVHRKGFWHQTFHCWFIEKETESILLQRRHKNKKDYPNALDITVAGHLEAGEGPMDGLREIKEEVGIEVQKEELISCGIFQGSIRTLNMIDNEFCHLFFYNNEHPIDRFILQTNEVASIVRIPIVQFSALFNNDVKHVQGEEYYFVNETCEVRSIDVTMQDFVSHEKRYYQLVLNLVNEIFNRNRKNRI